MVKKHPWPAGFICWLKRFLNSHKRNAVSVNAGGVGGTDSDACVLLVAKDMNIPLRYIQVNSELSYGSCLSLKKVTMK